MVGLQPYDLQSDVFGVAVALAFGCLFDCAARHAGSLRDIFKKRSRAQRRARAQYGITNTVSGSVATDVLQ